MMHGLSPTTLEKIARVAVFRRCAANEDILAEGQISEAVYFITEGEVRIYHLARRSRCNPVVFRRNELMQTIKFPARLAREWTTIEKMTYLYCHDVHHTPKGTLCKTCRELSEYAYERLRKCPFQEKKSTCANCTVHCYKPARREQVRVMMRYAGPRMLLHHPVLAILHLLDGKRKPPVLQRKSAPTNSPD